MNSEKMPETKTVQFSTNHRQKLKIKNKELLINSSFYIEVIL